MAHSKRKCVDCEEEHNYYCTQCGYETEACRECHEEVAHGRIHAARIMSLRPNESLPVQKQTKKTPAK